ncbi:MAG: transglycosylase domain-containing protein [Oscillospiraceae bacterium]|nr:transglycosylase domain-containing protein [Oscillospiraceae bacterium]
MSAKKASVKNKKKKRKGSGIGTAILTVFLVLFTIGVITVGSVAVTVLSDLKLISFGKTKAIEDEIAGVDYLDLENYITNQAKTTIIYAYDSEGELIEDTRLHGEENRLMASLDEISVYARNAVIALEDKRFRNHQGVDWYGTMRSIIYDVTGKAMQGGSTITQQLIKNLTGENKRTLIRKYNEIKNALSLERHFEKDEILEAYLNTMYLDQGCYGIKTGAEYYFGKDASDLTLMESAILVSITQKPRGNNPILNYDSNRERAVYCLKCMLEQGMISEDEYNKALNEKVVFVGKKVDDTEKEETEVEVSSTATEYQSWYTDYIIDAVIKDLSAKYGYTKTEAWRKVYYGGLSIYSAVDANIQSELDDVYSNRITFPKEEDTEEHPAIQSAMVIMDYEGRILGIAGALGEKRGNRVLSYATGDPRNPGSSIKPLSTYAPAVEGNYFYWSSRLPNYGITLSSGELWPSNYGGSYGSPGDIRNLADAIAPSLNTVPARIVQAMGTTYSYSFLRDRFRLSTLIASDNDYAPLVIGDMGRGATPLDMCAAYCSFGNGGLYYEPYCYYKVVDSVGKTILEPNKTGERILSEGTADVMNYLLQCPVTYSNGTARGYGVDGFTTFAKTGTSSDNHDKWMVGGTPHYVCASWVGFKDRSEINIAKYGTYPAAKVFREVMNRIHKGLEAKDFEYSNDSVRRSYCRSTGLLAGPGCGSTGSGWYKIDNLPSVCPGGCSGGGEEGPTSDEVVRF